MSWGQGKLDYIIEDMWVGLDKEVILSIPLFILCGNVMTRGSIAQRLISILAVDHAAAARRPGGGLRAVLRGIRRDFRLVDRDDAGDRLGHVSGDAAGRLRHLKFTLGAIMSGGTLGIIIPPSIPMIIYGLVTETSVTDLFAAGFGPGILLTVVLSIYSVWVNRHMPTERFDFARLHRRRSGTASGRR